MKLRCLEGDNAGKILAIDATGVTIGRETDCSLQFLEEGVSRRHARIMMEGKKVVVVDLNSTNGVRVNGERIAGRKVLVDGDRIGVGNHVLLVTAADSAAVPAAAPAKRKVVRAPRQAAAAQPQASGGGNAVVIIILLLLVALAAYVVMSRTTPAPPAPPPEVVDNTPPPEPPPRPEPPSRPIPDTDIDIAQPEPPPVAGNDRSGYYFVDTTPPGATVQIDGEMAGRTPLFIPQMSAGTHSLLLQLDGYEDHTRAFFVPAQNRFATIELAPSPGTCLITTDPPNATIMQGVRILGTAPMLLRDLPAGNHEVSVAEYGYKTTKQTLTISPYRADAVQVVLPPTTGTVAITTLPANARVFVDGADKGLSRPGPAARGESEPLIVSGLSRGSHTVEIEFGGRKSPPRRITISPGEAVTVQLAIWVPDTVVKTISGKTITGMLRSKNELGDLSIQTDPRSAPISLLNTQITSSRALTEDEARALLDKLVGEAP